MKYIKSKLILGTLLSLFALNVYADDNGGLATFEGKFSYEKNVGLLENPNNPPSEQLLINPQFVTQKDLTILSNYCQIYCVIRAKVVRGMHVNGDNQAWWLVRIVNVLSR